MVRRKTNGPKRIKKEVKMKVEAPEPMDITGTAKERIGIVKEEVRTNRH